MSGAISSLPIRLHGMVLSYKITGTTLPLLIPHTPVHANYLLDKDRLRPTFCETFPVPPASSLRTTSVLKIFSWCSAVICR
jgi:hypothetical protein